MLPTEPLRTVGSELLHHDHQLASTLVTDLLVLLLSNRLHRMLGLLQLVMGEE